MARYVAFRKLDGSPMVESDVHSVLGFMGPNQFWTGAADGTFTYKEAVQGAPTVNASAWYSTEKCYLFAYGPGIIVNRQAIDAKMPGGTSKVKKPRR